MEVGNRLVWSPDGRQIAYSSEGCVFQKPMEGGDAPVLLAGEPFTGSSLWPHSWSPDGKSIACTVQADPNASDDIWILPLEDDRKPYPILDTENGEYNPAFSPDGKWLAYVLNKSGDEQVYLMQFPSAGAPIQVSSSGGRGPIWSHDGNELYYVNGKTMMAVKIESDPNTPIGTPEELFTLEGPYSTAGNLLRTYDISSDGRFLMHRRIEDAEAQLICVQNWFEELKRLAPAAEAR